MASIGGAGLAPWGGAHHNMQPSNLGAPNIKLEEPMAAAAAALSHQPHASPPPQQQPPPQQPMPMMPPPPHHSLLVPSATAQAEAAAATHLVAQSGLSLRRVREQKYGYVV